MLGQKRCEERGGMKVGEECKQERDEMNGKEGKHAGGSKDQDRRMLKG